MTTLSPSTAPRRNTTTSRLFAASFALAAQAPDPIWRNERPPAAAARVRNWRRCIDDSPSPSAAHEVRTAQDGSSASIVGCLTDRGERALPKARPEHGQEP